MDIANLVDKLQADPEFASKAKEVAVRASRAGKDSPELAELHKLLSDDPSLDRSDIVSFGWTTTTTVTSPECLSTTTTTGH